MLEKLDVSTIPMPEQFGPLKSANGNYKMTGPCGDTMESWVLIENGNIVQCTFTSDGDMQSVSCGACVFDMMCGATINDVKSLKAKDILKTLPVIPEISERSISLAIKTLKGSISDYCNKEQITAQKNNTIRINGEGYTVQKMSRLNRMKLF